MDRKEKFLSLPRINYYEKYKEFTKEELQQKSWFVNIRGANGSGKSTIPLTLIDREENGYVLTLPDDTGKERDVIVVFPSFNTVALGKYSLKSGGMDSLGTVERKKQVIKLACELPFNVIMEGALDSTIFSTYCDLFKELEETHINREVMIFNFLPPLEVAIDRVMKRNGGREPKNTANKWKVVERNAPKFKEAGLNSVVLDNTNVRVEKALDWFFEMVEKYKKH